MHGTTEWGFLGRMDAKRAGQDLFRGWMGDMQYPGKAFLIDLLDTHLRE